jgi:uncharacterized protein (TIRG00374 family)
MKLRFFIFTILGIFILYAISHAINPKELGRQLSHFPKERILLLCMLSIVISVLKSWRFFLLLRKNNVKVTFWQICKVYIAGQSTTPVPGGEIFRSVLLKHETGADTKQTSGAVVMQALIVFFSSAVIAIVGSLIYGILINIALITLTLIIITIYLILNQKLFLKMFNKMKEYQRLKKPAVTLIATHKGVRNSLLHRGSEHKPGITFVSSVAIGLLSNLVGGLMIYAIVSAYNLPVNYIQSVYIYSMSIIIAAVSGVVPGGVGLAEGGITGLLVLLNIQFSKAFAIVLIFRAVNLIFYIVFGVIFLLLFYSKTLIFTKKVKTKK